MSKSMDTPDVVVFSSDGKEELCVVPSEYLELFMYQKGIKGRSIKAFKKAATDLVSEALAYHIEIFEHAKKILANSKAKKTKTVKKTKAVKTLRRGRK